MNQVESKKGGRFLRALPLLAAALIPFSALGASRSNTDYTVEDEINSGSLFFQSNNNLNLTGVVGNSGAIVAGGNDPQMVSVLDFSIPETITDLRVSTDTAGSLKLTWSAPGVPAQLGANVEGYEIRYSNLVALDESNFSTDGTESLNNVNDRTPGTGQTHVINGLQYNTAYFVSIVSSFNGTTSFVGQARVQPVWTLAPTPSSLSPAFTASGVRLTFDPENPGLHTLNYEVILATGNGVEFEINKIADSLSNNVLITPTFDTDAGGTSLNLIRDYYFFARVQNGGGVWTDWVSAYLPAPEVLPTGISLGEVKSSSLELSWTNPTGGPYDYYLVADTSLNFDSQERVSVLTTSNYTSGVIPGLKANTTYYLKIVKALGDLVSATPDTQAVTTVGQPLNVIVTLDGVNKSSATIRWTENLGNMIPGDHSYFVRVSSVNSNFSDPTKYFQKKLDYPPSEGTYQATFTELLPGNTPYYVQIIGVSRAGVQSVGPDTYSPGTPVFYTLPDQPQNVKFTSLGNSLTPENHLAVQWQHGSNNSTVTQYEVELTTTSGVWPATNHINFISRLTDPGATSTTTFVSIANQEYFVRVRAIAMETGANPSSWNESAPSTFTAVLGPVGLAVVNETTDTLTLQWNGEFFIDGKSFQNSPNTQYGVRWSTDPDFGSFLYDELILESPQVVMGRIFSAPLFPNTTYYIKITSIKTPNSTWPTVEEGAQGVTLALPPGDVDFKTYTSSASLAWDDSSGTYFRFKLKDNDGNIKDSNQKINISPEWIIGLSSNTTYYLQVKSLNHKDKENGSNSWEDYSPQATDAAAAELGATGFTLYTDSGTVTWGVGGNPEGTRYEVLLTTGVVIGGVETRTFYWDQVGVVDQRYELPQDLIKNKEYRVRVDAVGHNTKRVSSAERSGTTNSDKPGNVDLVVNGGNPTRGLVLTWDRNGNDDVTIYRVELSSTDFVGNPVAWDELTWSGAGKTFGFLESNKGYKARVSVKGANNWVASGEVYTWPEVPVGVIAQASVGDPTGNVKFGWGHGTNWGGGTKYEVEITTEAGVWPSGGDANYIGVGTSLGATSTGTVVSFANQQYYARVRALALDGDPAHDSGWTDGNASTWTAVLGPQAVGVVESSSTLRVTWVGNAGSVSNEGTTRYELQWKKKGAVSWVAPLVWKDQPPYELTAVGLTANTTYVMRLTAKADAGGGWSDEWEEREKVTLATVPVVGVYRMYTTSGTVGWGGNGNPVDTEYVAEMSVQEDLGNAFGPSEYRAGVLSATFTALTPNTTYWVRARGKNRAGVLTTGYGRWDPHATDAAAPVLGATGFTLYTDSGTVTWGVGGNPEGTRYEVLLTTGVVIGGVETRTFYWDQVGVVDQRYELPQDLIKNKEYRVRVDAVGHNTKRVSSAERSGTTNSDKPGNVDLVVNGGNPTRGLVLTWDRNGNDDVTIYRVELSSTDFVGNPVAWDELTWSGAGKTFGFLESNKGYKARVSVKGANNWVASGEVYTWPEVPVGVIAQASVGDPTGNVKFGWGHGTNWGGGTKYEVEITTEAGVWPSGGDANYIGVGTSLGATSTGTVVSFANQQYYARVRALALDGDPAHDSGWTDGNASTWTAVLGPQAVGVVESSSTLRVTWVGNAGSVSNEGTTRYELQWKKKGAVSWVAPLVWKDQPPYELTAVGLTANTTYVMRLTAKADAGGGWSDEWEEREKVTLATVPVVGVYRMYTTSGTVGWGGNGNPVDTEYVAEMSVQEDLGNAFGPSEYRAGVLSATFTALTPNTTYWVRARGKNRAGVLTTGYGRWDPHATDAAAPVLGATGFTLYTDSGTVTWGVGGNPEGTRYEVLLTTGVVIGGVETRTFYWDQVGVVDQRYELPQDLIKNKEYRVRVDAVGHNTKRVSSAERSGTTNSDKPGNVDLVVNGGNPTRGLVLTWDRNGNDDVTIYRVELSSTDFVGNPVAWDELTWSGAGKTFGFLESNKGYKARVSVKGANNWVASGEVYTWPEVPVGVIAQASVGDPTGNVKFGWGHGTNWGGGTKYEVEITTEAGVWPSGGDANYIGVGTSLGATSTGTVVSFANQQYYARVRALALDGDPAHDSGWTDGNASTWTAVLGPQAVGVVESSSTLRVTWVGNAGSVSNEGTTRYELQWKKKGAVSWVAPLVWKDQPPYELTAVGLTANTTYVMRLTAKADAGGGWSDEWEEREKVTLATVPVVGVYRMYTTSGTVGWGGNGNPVDTEYVAEMSVQEDLGNAFGPSEYRAGVLSATFTALTPNTTYWVRARGKNRAGVLTTGYGRWDPHATDAAAPVLGATGFTLYTDSGTVTWGVGGNPEGTRYEVLLTTGVVIGGVETRTFYWDQVGVVDQRYELPQDLIKNKEYRVRVDAVGHNTKRVSSAERSGTTNSDKPGNVDLVVNGGNPTRGLVLTWDRNGNDDVTIYRVELSSTDFVGNPVAWDELTWSGAGKTFGFLESNKGYKARVSVKGANNWVASGEVYTWPEVPVGVIAQASVGDPTGNVKFGWGHGTNWGGGTKYKVEITTQARVWPLVGDANYIGVETNLGATSAEVVVPLANKKYYAQVRALATAGSSAGPSGWTDGNASTWTAVLGPQAVGVVESSSTLRVTWVGNAGSVSNEGTTRYELQWKKKGAVSWVAPLVWKDQPPYELTAVGLTANTTYVMRLTAKADAGGGWSDEWEEREKVTLATVPVVGVYRMYTTSGTVGWGGNGNPVDTEYVAEMSVQEDLGNAFGPSEYRAGVLSATFTALTPNTTYWVRAWGKNRAGVVTTGYGRWDPQATSASAPVLGAAGFTLYTDSGTVTWNPNGNPEGTRYSVCVANDAMFSIGRKCDDNLIQKATEGAEKIHRVMGLRPNLPYYAKVEAHGHNGTVVVSDVSNEAETHPADVESIALEPGGDQSRELKLIWDKKGNSPRTKYAVELTTNSSSSWTTYPLLTDVSEYTFTGLISNQRYFARVKVEGGNYSQEQSTYTWPSAVVNLSSSTVANGTHEVKFEWAPGNNAEATIYEVLLSTENGGNRSEFPVRETVRGARSIVFGALEGVVWANEKYDVKVRVKPDNGNLTAPDKTASAWTEPLAVGSLVFPVVSSHSVQAQWGEPVSMVNSVAVVNAPGTGYTLEWSTREGELQSWKSLVGGQGGYSEWLEPGPPLTPDTTYYVIVRTKRRDNGVSTTFTPQTVVTNVSKPILGRLDISPSTRSSVVRWDRKSNPLDTMYEVAVYDGNKQMPPVIVRATHTIVGGLTPAKAYEFTVTAVGRGITPSRESSETVQKTTLPEPPLVEKIVKPVVVGDKQQLEVEWSKGANELINEYVARIYLVGSGTLPNYESSVSPAVFSGLDPNREYVVQIRSQNAVGDYSVSATTQTYTLPAVPGAPQATTILSNFQLGISFENQTQNPATTEYAVRLVAKAGFSGTPDASAGKYALLPGAGGTTTFSSDDPVWGRRSEWLGGSKLILTRLPDTFGYEVVLSARNDLKEEVGPGVGMAIAQSAGVPTVKMTLPTGEDLTQLDSLNKAIYYNGMTVPFTAVGSSHFNVLWSSRTRTIENNDMDQTYGWNGLLDVREDVVQADEDKFSKNDKAVGGFAVREEGEYFLNIAGTAMVDTGSGNLDVHDVFESTSPFRVYIDTTPPVAGALEVYFSSEAARDRNQEQRISTGTLWGDPNPYVTWDPRDLLGKEISRSPVEGWTVSVSTDEPVLPSVDRTELTKEVGFEVDLTGVKDSRIYYIKVRGYDRAGNWTADGDVPVFKYQYTPDQIAPRWSLNHIVMTGIRYPAIDKTIRFAAVAAANNFVDIGFEEEMLIPGDSIQLMMERDSGGVKVDKPSALTLPTTSYVMVTEESKTMVVLPFNATDLKPASLYRFYSSTKPVPTDRANNPLQTPLDILFYTAMDPAQKAVFVSEDGNVTVSVSAGSLGNEPVGVAINDAPEKVSVAGSASLPVLVGKATESIGQQTGGAFKKIFSIKELSVFDTKGKMRSAAYGGDVRLSFDITKEAKVENGTSYMKGTSIRTKDLAIYELDQRTGVWNKMPDSQVDEMTGTVSVPLRHNGTYAMGGSPNYDLSSAHAYPVPYRAQREQNGISFTGLSSFGTIKIYTLDGRLVKTLSYDGVSSADWNPVNSDGGDPVGSDVYLYVIENDQQRKVGKLMVIR